jgi:hypothetical protein
MTLDEAIAKKTKSSDPEEVLVAYWLTELKALKELENPALTPEDLLEILAGNECVLADGFEEALIGFSQQCNQVTALYDWDKCLKILIDRDGMTPIEAEEFFEYNTLGSWVGVETPVFAQFIGRGVSMVETLESIAKTEEESPLR